MRNLLGPLDFPYKDDCDQRLVQLPPMAFSIFDPQIPWWTDDLYAKAQIVEIAPGPIPESPQLPPRQLRPEYVEEITKVAGNYVEIRLTPDAMEATVAPPNLPELPIEVWEKIIDHTWHPGNDRRAVVACALSCRAWLLRCRYHLYRRLSILSEGGLNAVIETLSRTPSLGNRVHSLDVNGSEHYNTALIVRALLQLGTRITNVTYLHINSLDLSHGHLDLFFKALSLFRSRRRLQYFTLSDYRFTRHSQLVRCASTANAQHFDLQAGILSLPANDRQQSRSRSAAHLDTLRFRDVSRRLEISSLPSYINLMVSWIQLSDLCERLRFAVSGPGTITLLAQQREEDDLRQIGPTVVSPIVRMICRFCSLTQHQVSVAFSLPFGGRIVLSRSAGGEHLSFLFMPFSYVRRPEILQPALRFLGSRRADAS